MPSPACYKFTVSTAEEAAALIRERLGPEARVLSVRSQEQSGFSRFWSKPKLEVIAQVGETPAPAPLDGSDDEPEFSPGSELSPGSGSPSGLSCPAGEPETPGGVPLPGKMPLSRRLSRRPADLVSLLKRSGLSDLALGRLQSAEFWPQVESAPIHRALVDIGWNIRRQADARWSGQSLRRAAFIGTPGCGRTTALCKWLGREVFRRARSGHVVTVEFERPNPTGTLPVFCEALGVPVARFPAATEPVTPGGFVYFELPGLSLRNPAENRAIAQFLAAERIEERVLVLNAAYDHATLRSAYSVARELGATHVVFTHLDEVPHWGRLWDYLLDGALEPLFLATGPSLTGDCEEDVFDALVRRTLAAEESSPPLEPSAGRDAVALTL